MSKHSSGDWELEIGSLGALSIMADGMEIAKVDGSDADAECLAHAKLMAAAHDMLEALKEAEGGNVVVATTYKIRAAIAKAEGKCSLHTRG